MKEKIIDLFKKHYYILTGLLIFLSFPTYNIWLLNGIPIFAWLSLLPLLIYIREKSYKDIILSSFIAGFIGNFFVYSWIGDFGANVGGGNYVILAFLIPSLTVFFITKIIIAEYLSRKFEKYRILIYPSVWLLVEWIQSIGFLAFPWTYWGYSQFRFLPFIQISSIIGIMGITFILILSNNLIADFFFRYFKSGKIFKEYLQLDELRKVLIFFVIILIIVGYGQFIIIKSEPSNKKDIKVAVIQSCISPWENWMQNRYIYLEHLEYYTKLSLQHEPDMIIWSESATLENISYHNANGNLNAFERKVLDIAKSAKKPLVTGEIGIIEDDLNRRFYPQNNAVLIDENGIVVNTYAKINLVPFGEWFPYEKWFPLIKDLLYKFGASNFVPGTSPLLFNSLNRNFGVLVCYEGIFFRLCRAYKKLGAEFFINITNLGWTESYAGHIQQLAASRFRAIENGMWFISASNTGITAMIDPYGRITQSIPRLERGYMISHMNFDLNHNTLYAKYGDVFFYSTMIFLFVLLMILVYKFFSQRYIKT